MSINRSRSGNPGIQRSDREKTEVFTLSKISDDELADQITYGFLRTFNKIQQGRRALRHFGSLDSLTLIEAEMCIIISQQPGISGGEFAKLLSVTPSATSQAISKLKDKGCIRQETDRTNAKTKRLYITEKGSGATDVAYEYYQAMKKELFGTTRRELQAYMRFISKLENFHDSIRKIMGDK